MSKSPVTDKIVNDLKENISQIESILDSDVLTIYGVMGFDLDRRVKDAIDAIEIKKNKMTIILDTIGGSAEIVERMVSILRHFYLEVFFIIPNRAMSAGTIFAMSGDKIFMNYFSVLGPIDPQIERDGKWVPALSYLNKFEELIDKSNQGALSTAEYTLLSKLDLGELEAFKQARELSIELLEKWLSTYKFKDWKNTNTRQIPVDDDMKKKRAKEIAEYLSDYGVWKSHSRGISLQQLTSDKIKLEIDDLDKTPDLSKAVSDYFDLFSDFLQQKNIHLFVHSRHYI
ncbi:MAG: SDH family Clp fold serine proteinase [Bdellovibrio sp.]